MHDYYKLIELKLKRDPSWPDWPDNNCPKCGKNMDNFYSDDEQEGKFCYNCMIVWLR